MSGHTTLAPAGTAAKRKEARTVILSSYLGSTIEFYDFLLYATAAAVAFPKVFFAGTDEWVGVVAASATGPSRARMASRIPWSNFLSAGTIVASAPLSLALPFSTK